MKSQTICVLGGTGFVGSHLVAHLANCGHRLKILTRHRERHKQFMVMPNVQLVEADIYNQQSLAAQFSGCDAVINLIGILNGSEEEFRALHAQLPKRVAEACCTANMDRLLHMSALNADAVNGPSLYLRTKGEGEQAILQVAEKLKVTIFRPSIIFGPDDSFFNRFAGLLKLSPILPLACPNARFAPVYVDDVSHAFALSLDNPATFGKTLELCGPRVYTLKELVDYTAQLIGRKRLIMGLSDMLSRLQAKIFGHVPGKPFTLDNYQSMQVDSVCQVNGFEILGITPHSVEAIMPLYFTGRLQRDRYRQLRSAARRD